MKAGGGYSSRVVAAGEAVYGRSVGLNRQMHFIVSLLHDSIARSRLERLYTLYSLYLRLVFEPDRRSKFR